MKVLKRISVYLISLLLLSSCSQSRPTFSKAVTRFDDSIKGTSTMYFYPAVLDVLNYSGDSTMASVIKDIKKIKIVRLSKDTIRRTIADSLIDGVKNENFVSLMEMGREGYLINLFMKKQSHNINQYVAVAYSPKSMMVIDLLGNIPFKYLPVLLSNSTNFSGFSTVLNAKRQNDRNKNNKENKNDKSKSEDGKHTRDK
ncbi:MAG: DUF4252 domain-containing protein [Bacteroidales bacterium]|nr:DUF4252 domain-containing protein [Bacteroidales bacterium]